jgi:Leucine-rich repeat (LRR) protein
VQPTAALPEGARSLFQKVIEFPDNQQERRLRQILEASDGDILQERLQEITELYFVGTMSPKSTKGLEISEDGTVTMNTIPVKQGSVGDLKLVYMMPNLKHLAVVNQPLKDISGMKDLVLLLDLNLACTQVSDLSGISNLPSLQTLNLEHTQVKDLTPLSRLKEGTTDKELPLLTQVTVSKDMLPLTMDPDAWYEVILVK